MPLFLRVCIINGANRLDKILIFSHKTPRTKSHLVLKVHILLFLFFYFFLFILLFLFIILIHHSINFFIIIYLIYYLIIFISFLKVRSLAQILKGLEIQFCVLMLLSMHISTVCSLEGELITSYCTLMLSIQISRYRCSFRYCYYYYYYYY